MNSTIKNILRILSYGVLFFLIERYLTVETTLSRLRLFYSQPLMIFVSIIRGPLVGGLAMALGEFLLQIGADSFDWIKIGCAFLNCAAIGFLMRNLEITDGFFERKDIIHFNNTHLLIHTVCWAVVSPVLSWFLMHTDLRTGIKEGLWLALGFYLSNLVITTMFLSLYARTRISAAKFYRS